MSTPHKWAEILHAVADCKAIQFKKTNEWIDFDPVWHCLPIVKDGPAYNFEWRIKPEPKPDVVVYFSLEYLMTFPRYMPLEDGDDLKVVIDGETGKLKSAEVVK